MPLTFPRTTRCCFCIPLRMACFIIGYFSIIMSCVIIAGISYYAYRVSDYVNHYDQHPLPGHSLEDAEKMAISLYISFGYYILVFLFNVAISAMLVVGVHKNKPELLKYYVNSAYVLLALAVTLIVLTCVFMGFLATIPMLKWAVTIVFCIIVVRSTYLEMEEQNKPKSFEMQNLYMPQQAPLMV